MNISFAGQIQQVHPSWESFFISRRLEELEQIEERIGFDFTPPAERVLRFAGTDLARVKIVILGQDPYPQRGTATGRSFEVGGINSWNELKRNASLVNILKLLHMNCLGRSDIAPVQKVREDIESGIFPVLPPDRLFSHWEAQGVLMLNAALTCEVNNSGSHSEIWTPFVHEALSHVAENCPQAKWFLWGRNAQQFCSFVPESARYESHHPRLYNRTPGSFLAENHFARIADIDWTG